MPIEVTISDSTAAMVHSSADESKEAARTQRERTAKWRASREARRVPEARQVDRAVLLAFIHVGMRGRPIGDDELTEIRKIALDVLARRHDKAASSKAIRSRLGALSKSREIDIMRSWPSVTP